MNSPLEEHEVRLRGLGGPAERCVRDTFASATGPAGESMSFRGSERAIPSRAKNPARD
jgi:hypothetical protein